ncbi:MAG: winged helix-turn-helix domain-containing protein [Woeseiaceae bacterium]
MDASQFIRVGDWAVTPAQNLIERDGETVRLKPRAMDVLVYLANHAGEVVSANELISSIWQGRIVGDGTVYQIINQLRRALGDRTDGAGYIETISKRGYRLMASVLSDENSTADSHRNRIQSMVVLPLNNLSGGPEQEFFADGMTEVLIANLARIRALKIISRTSAMRYKGSQHSLPEIAKELDVDAVVEGSVLRAGDKVRITIQLIHAASDTHLWAENYERDVQDVLLLQSEVAQAVTQAIQVAVTPEEKKNLARARQVNPEAYEAYLKGRYHYWSVSPGSFDTALKYYSLALDIDPDYALAYAGISDVWGARGCFGFASPREAFSMGNPAAIRAVEMDDRLAEGHEMLARYKTLYEWDWSAAEMQCKHAISLSPNNPDVGFAYFWLLLICRRFPEAEAQAGHALRLDPFNLTFQCMRGWQLLYERHYEDAIAQFEHLLTAEANNPWPIFGLCSSYVRTGKHEQALKKAQQYLSLTGRAEAANAMQIGNEESGYQLGMLRAADVLVAQSKGSYVQAILIARLYAFAQKTDLALDWLEKAFALGEPWISMIGLDLDWDNLREEPRFKTLLRKLGFESRSTESKDTVVEFRQHP